MIRRAGVACTGLALLAVLSLWVGGLAPGTSAEAQGNWSLTQMRAPVAWQVSRGEGVTIGVVDSGVDSTAPGVAGKVTASADCVGSGGQPSGCRPGGAPDSVGHGTIVTEVAASVAPAAKFVVARAVGPSRTGYDDDVAAAIDWAVDNGAQIVNVSLAELDSSGVFIGPNFSSAVERAWARGAVPVLAAGNLPGTSPYGNLDALVVGATTAEGTLAAFSTRPDTAKWGVAAPGGAVASLPGGGEITRWGTSVASPNGAGAVALLLARGGGRDAAVQRLLATAVPCGGCGHGRIDVAAALGVVAAPPSPPPPPPVPPRPSPLPAPSPPRVSVAPGPALEIPDASLLDRAPSLAALE